MCNCIYKKLAVTLAFGPKRRVSELGENMQSMEWSWWRKAIVASFAVGASTFFTAALIPFDLLKEWGDSLLADGDAGFLTVRSYLFIRVTLILLGLGFTAASVGVYRFGAWVEQHVVPRLQEWLLSPYRALGIIRSEVRQIFSEMNAFHTMVFAVIFLVAAALRIGFSLTLPIRNDEAYTFLHFALRPAWQGLTDYSYPNNHILHTLLVDLSANVFGSSIWALRLPAVLAGIAICPLTYCITRAWYNKEAALLAFALCGVSSFLIEYGAISRGYSLQALCFLLVLLAVRYLGRRKSPLGLFLFVVATAAGFLAMPTMLYGFGVILIWTIFRAVLSPPECGGRTYMARIFLGTVLSGMVTLLLYAPAIYVTGLEALIAHRFIVQYPYEELVQRWPKSMLEVGQLWTRDMPVLMLVLGGIGLLVHGRARREGEKREVHLYWAVFWCVFPMLLVQRIVPYPRIWMFLLPLFLGALGGGLSYLVDRWSPEDSPRKGIGVPLLALCLMVWGGGLVWHNDSIRNSSQDYWLAAADQTAVYLRDSTSEEDKILVVCPSDKIMQFHALRAGIPWQRFMIPADSSEVLLIVNERTDTIEKTLKAYEFFIAGEGFSDRVIFPLDELARFEDTVIYRMEMLPATN